MTMTTTTKVNDTIIYDCWNGGTLHSLWAQLMWCLVTHETNVNNLWHIWSLHMSFTPMNKLHKLFILESTSFKFTSCPFLSNSNGANKIELWSCMRSQRVFEWKSQKDQNGAFLDFIWLLLSMTQTLPIKKIF